MMLSRLPCSPVSIRAPAWGATGAAPWSGNQMPGFNSRSRVGSDSPATACTTTKSRFQFALPRGERPTRRRGDWRPARVSIRAPAWGATVKALQEGKSFRVSIRAPAWGATDTTKKTCKSRKFQFALPRGERHTCGKYPTGRQCFNSRSRVGSDLLLFAHIATATMFQFALPRGERRRTLTRNAGDVVFQFALPRGERQ